MCGMSARITVQDYKSLHATVMICATLVNTQTHSLTDTHTYTERERERERKREKERELWPLVHLSLIHI